MRTRRTKEAALGAAAKLLGRKGGVKGGPTRAQVLSEVERKKIASMGGRAAHGKDRKE
jgi:hypothetical protein